MKICLIGNSLTALSLAKNLTNKKIYVFNYIKTDNKKIGKTRTIGISKDSLDFFNKDIIKIKKKSKWDIKKIEVYAEKYNNKKILNFENSNTNLFSMVKNFEIYDSIKKKLNKNKFYKKIRIENEKKFEKILNANFNLVINCDINNFVTKKFFFKKITKNYKSIAFTTIIEHAKIENNIAYQIFTSKGPLAFLPLSKFKTSIVYSINHENIKFNDNEILKLINFYNFKYKISNFSKIEKFNLSYSVSRNYFHKNILNFGDAIHRIHPLAGQGFNINLRDIKILSELIQKRIDLGLSLDYSVLEEFEKKTKHLNYIFTSAIDLVYEFFKFDNKINNNFSKNIFKIIDKNKAINKFLLKRANQGIIL
tara:strand:- start:4396 stop:5490 length:1095 start_codon:yes stop_codon:yes gene_type:complete